MEEIFDIVDEIIDDENELEDILIIVAPQRALRTFHERIALDNFTDYEFLVRFRISKHSAELILARIHHLLDRVTLQNHALTSATQLLLALRFYASGSMIIVVADFSGIHKSTASVAIKQVSQAIASLAPDFIQLPQNQQELNKTKAEFYNMARFPNVMGAVDCTHARIQSPGGNHAENYRNRKGFFSINVQTLSDASLKITNIVARWPGAANDRNIFNNSRLKAVLNQGTFGDSFILGDSCYTLSEHVLIPVNEPRTRGQNLYNESHIRTRNIVERQYGIWKRRFQVLRLELRLKLSTTVTVIVATAVLHNIALHNNDPEPPNDDYEEELDEEEYNPEIPEGNGLQIRDHLINNYFANLQ